MKHNVRLGRSKCGEVLFLPPQRLLGRPKELANLLNVELPDNKATVYFLTHACSPLATAGGGGSWVEWREWG